MHTNFKLNRREMPKNHFTVTTIHKPFKKVSGKFTNIKIIVELGSAATEEDFIKAGLEEFYAHYAEYLASSDLETTYHLKEALVYADIFVGQIVKFLYSNRTGIVIDKNTIDSRIYVLFSNDTIESFLPVELKKSNSNLKFFKFTPTPYDKSIGIKERTLYDLRGDNDIGSLGFVTFIKDDQRVKVNYLGVNGQPRVKYMNYAVLVSRLNRLNKR